MPIPTITPLPVPPSRADATSFASRADAFLGALPTFQTEMNAAAAAIDAAFFPPVFRNRLINGDFSVWQRGASQASAGYGSADRWEMVQVGTTRTHSRQAFTLGQTAVPGEPRFFSRHVVASVAGATNLALMRQAIEGVRTFAGRTVRLSFYAKADAARSIAVEFVQSFGTGGAGGSALVLGIGAQKFNLTTAWQRFTATVAIPSISGKTLGSSDDDWLGLNFWFDAGSAFNSRTATLGQQSGTFDVALVQVEEGTSDTAFEFRPPGVELALCQRYFEKSNAIGEPFPGISAAGAAWFMTSATGIVFGVIPFKVEKRTPYPTTTYYDLAGTANRVTTPADDGFAISSGGVAGRQGVLQIDAAWVGVGASTKVMFQWAVNAEL